MKLNIFKSFNNKKNEKEILLLGPQINKLNPNEIGGIIVLFENLINHFNKKEIIYEVIDTNKNNYSNKIIAMLSIYFLFLRKCIKVSHISLHGTANDFIIIAPLVVFIANLLNKKVSLRKFAGNFDEIYNNSGIIQKLFIKYILKNSSVVFFETKYLVDYFRNFNENTYWFPNVRDNTILRTNEIYDNKFIFLGTVSKEKGIQNILDSSKFLDSKIKIDIYGKLIDYKKEEINKYTNIEYKGELSSTEVLSTMINYDVLLLPSLREGYPGVIIEAFSIGLPVIATKLEGISEMFDENYDMLIEKNDINKLCKLINSIDNEKYLVLREYMLTLFNNFNSVKQTELFLNKIEIV